MNKESNKMVGNYFSRRTTINDWLDCCVLDWSNTPPPGKVMWPERIDCRPVEEHVDTSQISYLFDLYNYTSGNETKCNLIKNCGVNQFSKKVLNVNSDVEIKQIQSNFSRDTYFEYN